LEEGRPARRWGWLEGGLGALATVEVTRPGRGRDVAVVELGDKDAMAVARGGRRLPQAR
jgi:hypothetical protein